MALGLELRGANEIGWIPSSNANVAFDLVRIRGRSNRCRRGRGRGRNGQGRARVSISYKSWQVGRTSFSADLYFYDVQSK